jgi:prephenate dehydratase
VDRQREAVRVAFQGEPGAFSEAAAIQLLGEAIATVPCPNFDLGFRAITEGAADLLLAPIENTLAGSVVRVYDLLLQSDLEIVAETILHIEHQLIGCPGARLGDLRSVASHPVALAQCERFFQAHPDLKRVPAEDTAGSVREVLDRGDLMAGAIAGRRAAERYGGLILVENIHDNPENFTRFVLLCPKPGAPASQASALLQARAALHSRQRPADQTVPTLKMSLALRLAHQPGALLAALEPFARHRLNLLKIESRPIHGQPWEYQFFVDIETATASARSDRTAEARLDSSERDLKTVVAAVRAVTSELRILGLYAPARSAP